MLRALTPICFRGVQRAGPPDSQGSTIMDLQQDQSYAQIVTGFIIAISLVLGLIVVSVFF
jgi:hypothetical protein